jgi:hypothetical protein
MTEDFINSGWDKMELDINCNIQAYDKMVLKIINSLHVSNFSSKLFIYDIFDKRT